MLGVTEASRSFYVRVRARAPWAIEFASKEQARLVVVARGSCILTSDQLEGPAQLAADDAFIVQAGVDFTLQDELGREAVDCERVFASAEGHTVDYGGAGGPTEIVSGRFSFDAAAGPLLEVLPSLLRIRLDDRHSDLLRATLQLMALETSEDGLGSSQILGRLADVLFVQALRAWAATEDEHSVGWLAALQDPNLSRAMRAMHADLGRPWTVEGLAREVGLSRSAFAAHFRQVAGETPLAYLTFWRMYRAKTLLREGHLSILEIATSVGYDTDTALSRAFKRTQGVAPGEWRRLQRAPRVDLSKTRAGDPSGRRAEA